MLVERGLRVMNVDVIGKAYDIAAHYLRAHRAAPRYSLRPMRRCCRLIVQMFQRGDTHQLRLANRAIASSKPAGARETTSVKDVMQAADRPRDLQTYAPADQPRRRRAGARQGRELSSKRCATAARPTSTG